MKKSESLDWPSIYSSLNEKGYAVIREALSREECEYLTTSYSDPQLYRNVINMQRYRFGKGEYKYFNYPLPSIIQILREELYKPLSKIANEWMQKLSLPTN